MSIARKSIQEQAAAEQAKVQSWQRQRQADIDREAEELRRKQREEASKAEQQAQAEIAKAEKAVATARKQRALGVEPDLAGLKANKEKAIESQKQELSKAKEAKTELQKAEKEARAEVETIAKEATTELEAQQRLAMAEVAKLQEDNVELDNGEWIDKKTYNSLSTEDKAMINKLGIEKFNRYKQKEFESNNVKLSDGSWISLETYNSLPPEQQNILRTQGITGYEKWQQEQIAASNADSWKALQDLITATGISSSVTQEQWNNMTPEEKQNTYDYLLEQYTVTVGNDEIVSKGWYEDLNPEFQAIVAEGGTTALDEYIADNYVTTDNEELIDKDYYNSLTSEQKDYILRNGSDKFQQEYFVKLRSTQELIDKKEYEALPPEVQKMLQEKGITETNNYYEKQKKDFEDKHIKLDNGDYIDKDEYYKMTPQEQALLRTLGIDAYNAKKQEEFKKAQEDYIKSLPKEAQDYIKLVGFERFNEAYHNALKEQEAGRSPDGQLKIIGLVPNYAENVTIDKDGVISYEGTPNFKAARVIDLEKLDFNNLSEQDYLDVLKTVISNSEGKETKLDLWQIATHYNEYKQYFKTLSKEQKAAMEKVAKKYASNKFINVLSFVFPPAQALKPEVTIKDIKGTEWAEGFASVALLFVAPAIGAIGKAGSAAAKVASIASKGIQAAGTAVYGTTLGLEWKEMDIKEQAISSVLTGIIAVPLAGTAIKSLASKLNPKGAAIQALRQSEKKIAKNFSDALKKSYHPEVAKSYDKLARIQNTYIKAAYKGKTTAALDQRLKNAADGFVKTLKKHVTKPIAEERELLSAIERIPETIVRNTKEMVRIATQSKVNIKQLKKDAIKAREKFDKLKAEANDTVKSSEWEAARNNLEKAKKAKNANDIKRYQSEFDNINNKMKKQKAAENKLSEAYIELIDAELKLRQFGSTPINEKYKQLIKYKDELETLKSYKPKSKTKRAKNIDEINKLEAKIKKLESELMQELKKADVEWAPDSSGSKGGGTAVATKPITTTRISSALATELKMKGRTLPEIGSGSVGSSQGSRQGTAVQTKPVDAVSTKTIQRINEKYQEFVQPKTSTGTKPKAVPFDAAGLQSAITTVTSQGIKAAEDAIAANANSTEIRNITSASIDTAIQALPDTKIQGAIKTEASQLVTAAIKTATKAAEKAKYTKRIPIKITDKEGETPTPEQLAAAVGWKQGWAYWYIYPPAYGKGGKCRIIRKTPIKGIPLFKDAKSAYLSLTKIGKGELPEAIKIPMGITDLIIRTAKGGKPKSQYKKKKVEIPRLRTTK